MTQLQTLQSAFQQALLQDHPLNAALLSARGVAQFGVYRIAYRARLRAALRDNFETLPRVMGDDAFDALAHAYIASHPSQHYSLRWFGHRLCDFMAANEALVDHPAMVDLARLEWALRQAFDAAPAELLTSEALAAIPPSDWADLRLTLQPSVQVLDLQWAVGPIWHALKSGQDELEPPEALNHSLLVWRLGMNTQWKSLTQTEAGFVQGLLVGHTFGQLCAALAERVGLEQAAASAVALLTQLLQDGALCALPTPIPATTTR
jgi:hypothetical protein